ncbi:DUF6502 family protein [Rhodoblastus acidophilus]|uniref:DUF6502 family protein n=1 Tax=Candidatus Rhodoblastus alkanivorans TaxID=2954117 RepID=A0ABS9ZAQ6_9HYPH|nr:DUF6502 family protein [Candidatus Rhodoblastus alkanivorans]MCI4677148.1 DUF6502 family protein [Candidatus Rhodoblastus alkanivorans]MCI4684501.1 DUF6502 family protein [Candidatus Rhodoblastus alkanivorans]MDI4641822.1 DUF6502 family protein [Rhodoblastus acidophilus]
MTEAAPPPDAARLQTPIARILRPLVRLFIRCGMTFPALCDLLRELYVNVAEYDFALRGKEQTDSRVSLLTGIHRKEVRRLRGAGAPVRLVPASVSRSSMIIARWVAAPQFTDDKGAPLPLRRAGDPGDGPTYDELVESVTRDVRPRAVLDEWLDRGMVTIDSEGRVRLEEAAFAPRAGDDRQLYYFGRNLHDHVAAAVENILAAEPPFFERAVHYEGVSQAMAENMLALSRRVALEALKGVNREAQGAMREDPGGTWRWNFGLYLYGEDESLRREAPAEDDGGKSE